MVYRNNKFIYIHMLAYIRSVQICINIFSSVFGSIVTFSALCCSRLETCSQIFLSDISSILFELSESVKKSGEQSSNRYPVLFFSSKRSNETS